MSELTVYLWRDGLRVARRKARYTGGSYLFIHTDPLPHKKGESITLEFPLARPDGLEQAACVAQIVRRTPAGLDVQLRVISTQSTTRPSLTYRDPVPTETGTTLPESVGHLERGGRTEMFWEESDDGRLGSRSH